MSARTNLFTRNFLMLSVMNIVLTYGTFSIYQVLPLHMEALGASGRTIGLISTMFTFSSALTRPFAGALIDRRGRRLALFSGLAATTVVLVLYSLVADPESILLIRVLQGLVWGLLGTTISTMAADNIPMSNYGEGISIFNMTMGLASAITPLVAIPMFHRLGFSPVVYIATLAGAVSFLISLRLKFRQVAADTSARPAAAVKQSGLIERSALLPAVVMFFIALASSGVDSFIALYGQYRNVGNIGLVMTVYALTGMFLRPLMGRLCDKFGTRQVLFPGIVLIIAALFMLSSAQSLGFFMLCAVILSVGLSAAPTALTTLAITKADPERLGAANATFSNGWEFGRGVGSVTAGFLLDSVGFSRMFAVLAAGPSIGIIISYIASRQSPASTNRS